MRVKRLRRFLTIHAMGIFSAMLLLNGCVNQPAVPQDYFYRLPELKPRTPDAINLINGVLSVDELQAEGVYRERPILYVDSQRPLEVVQYHYRHWMQTPSQLIQDNLVEFLRQANVASRVERYSGDSSAALRISGRLQKFEQWVQPSGATAVVEMEIELRLKTPQGTKKQTRIYQDKVMAEGPAIHDSVAAFGQALQHIYDKLLADLNAMVESASTQ